jgi:signal transduction histidine kinase/ActR/RegA family two-component response regulator
VKDFLKLRDRPASLLALAAGTAGFGLNFLGLPIFDGTEIIFGGAITLLATFALGPWWGLLATGIAFSATTLTWGHPWGLLCFSLEAFAVGWLHTRRGRNPVQADILYWLFVGGPLSALAIFGLLEVPFPADWAIVIKYPLNSLLMVAVALPVYQSERFRLALGLPLECHSTTSLQHILFRRLGLIITLSIATLGLFAGGAFDRVLRQQADDELSSDGREVALAIQSYLDRHLRAVTHLADLYAVAGTDEALRPDPLGRARSLYPGFLTLLVTDESGLITAAWPERNRFNVLMANNGFRVADRAYFLEPRLTRRSYVSDIFRGRGFGDELIVAMSAPIHDRNGRFRGVAEGSLDLRRLGDAIGRPGQLHDRTLVVVDRTGRVVLRAGEIDAQPLQSFTPHDLYFAAREQDTGTFLFDNLSGGHAERYLATRHLVPDFGWQIYLAEPLWRTQSTIATFYLASALVAAAAIGLALLLARGTAAAITLPLTHLAAATRRMAQPGAEIEPGPVTHFSRELAEINRELHGTAVNLSRSNRELANTIADRDQTHENLRGLLLHLEDLVRERTLELDVARQAAESASQAKTEFLASMSHELRTPLNVIVGMSELMAEQTLGPLTPRQAEGLQNVNESGRHLLELINDILDLSKIEAGQLQLDFQPMEIAGVCAASLRFVRETARRKDIRVGTDVPPDLAPVLADERRVKQILVNLLANAVKFTPAGGRVGLDARIDAAAGQVRFEVWDTGIGIDPAHFERIFQPFQQIDSSLSRQYSGTGLGLALVRRMAGLHGGSVEVRSEIGRGSRFIVLLPWRAEAGAPAAATPAADSAFPFSADPLHLLIAEDNAANRQVYAAYFNSRPCRVTYATNGREALDLAFALHPDLVLMDVHMPVMDGLEATRLLRADPRTAALPIVVVTALAMPEDRLRCLDAGASAYLTKPINLRELSRTIARFTAARTVPAEPASAP